jgi:hypothetical protein
LLSETAHGKDYPIKSWSGTPTQTRVAFRRKNP